VDGGIAAKRIDEAQSKNVVNLKRKSEKQQINKPT